MTEIDDLTVDTTDAQKAIARVLAMTDKTNEKLAETDEKVNTLRTNLAGLDEQAVQSLRTGLSIARRGVLLMQLFTSGAKNAVTKAMVIMSQAALIAAETVLTIATASSFTVVGAINAALGFAAFASLTMQASQILRFGEQAGRQFDDLERGIQAGNIVFAGW